jgi:hypothetical protein
MLQKKFFFGEASILLLLSYPLCYSGFLKMFNASENRDPQKYFSDSCSDSYLSRNKTNYSFQLKHAFYTFQ